MSEEGHRHTHPVSPAFAAVASLRGASLSGRDPMGEFVANLSVQADRLQPEGVLSFWNHRHRDGTPVGLCMHVPGFEPSTQPGIEDLWLALPECRLQSALDLKMIQHQLDARDALWEIAPDVVHAHMKSSDSASLALRLDHHTYLPFNVDDVSLGSRSIKACCRCTKLQYRFLL